MIFSPTVSPPIKVTGPWLGVARSAAPCNNAYIILRYIEVPGKVCVLCVCGLWYIKKIVQSLWAWKSFRWNIALWPERRPLSSMVVVENGELLMCTSCRSCDGILNSAMGCVCRLWWSLWLFLLEVGRNRRGLMSRDGRSSSVLGVNYTDFIFKLFHRNRCEIKRQFSILIILLKLQNFSSKEKSLLCKMLFNKGARLFSGCGSALKI